MQQDQELEDSEIMDRLDQAYQAHLLKTDPKWVIIQRWLRSERDKAQARLNTCDPDKKVLIARYQECIRMCNTLAERIFIGIEKEGELALIEARERELVPDPDRAEETVNAGA